MSVLFPLLALAVTSSTPSAPDSPAAPADWSPLFAEAIAPSTASPLVAYHPVPIAPSDDLPEMEYTYVEANYIVTDSDDLDETLKGVELTGSLELPLNFFGQVTYTRQSNDADVDVWKLGAGYHLPIGSRLDAYGILSYVHAEVSDGIDDSEDGAAAELGVRFMLLQNVELNGAAKWIDLNEDDYGIAVGARWYLIDRLSFGGRLETIDSDTTVALGARFEL
jgi:opacity protein-like surface antigen